MIPTKPAPQALMRPWHLPSLPVQLVNILGDYSSVQVLLRLQNNPLRVSLVGISTLQAL